MSKELFLIIHQLSPAERNYCKKRLSYSHQEDSNQLVQLFGWMYKQKKYDSLLMQKFFIKKYGEKSISSVRTKLYHRLLDILSQYDHLNNIIETKIRIQIKRARALIKRQMYDAASHMLRAVLETCKKYQHEVLALEVLDLLMEGALATSDLEYVEQYLQTDIEKERELLEQYLSLKYYKGLWAQTFLFTQTYNSIIGNEERQQKLSAIKKSEFLTNENKANSPLAKFYFHRINGFMDLTNGGPALALEHIVKTHAIFVQHKYLIERYALEYLKTLRNLLISFLSLKQYSETDAIFNELNLLNEKKLIEQNEKCESELFIIKYGLRSDIFFLSERYVEAIKLLPVWEERYISKQKILALSDKRPMLLKFNLLYHLLGNFKMALKYNNELLLLSDDRSIRQDLLLLAEVSGMMIHYDLGNENIVENRLVAFKRKMKNTVEHISFVQDLCEFMPMLIAKNKSLPAEVQKRWNNLIANPSLKGEREYLNFMPVYSWLLARINNKSWLNVIEKK